MEDFVDEINRRSEEDGPLDRRTVIWLIREYWGIYQDRMKVLEDTLENTLLFPGDPGVCKHAWEILKTSRSEREQR